ncbi:MFS transporter [Propionimicrobium lymphophilum]|uniref:MFS transporter n=1 Tax=Propionimicrobium lymphophilum TaxID=33012 RepID=UPI000427D9DF|nr:MFS transporter [Propionimicrobium lymphophilum]
MSDTTTETSKPKKKLPAFLRKGKVGGYLAVVATGQLVYSSFEAFKGSLILPMCNALGITMAQFGQMMSVIGLAMFMYVPGGWVNNRFPIKNILTIWAGWRLFTTLVLYLIPGMPFQMMLAIAFTWAVGDAVGWPAVVNGVSYLSKDSDSEGRGLAMGLLETIRRALEFVMNLLVVGALFVFPEQANIVMRGFAIAYALFLIPMILLIRKYVPNNAIAKSEGKSENQAALIGLIQVLKKPRLWLAGLAGLCVYWSYVNLIYSSAPYLSLVFNASDGVAGAFGIFNTGFIGIIAGLLAGMLADYVFKSSTMMMAVGLSVIAIGSGLLLLLPANTTLMWPAMVLLMLMAMGVFLGKAVILAPVAELNLPEEINGSAMSVGSFLVYASIIWGNLVTSGIVDAHKDNPQTGYAIIFTITLVVAISGAVCAFFLATINHRINKKAKQA